jgi:hypothetical protein
MNGHSTGFRRTATLAFVALALIAGTVFATSASTNHHSHVVACSPGNQAC